MKKKLTIDIDFESGEIRTSHFFKDTDKREKELTELFQQVLSYNDNANAINHFAIIAEIMINFVAGVAINNSETYHYLTKWTDTIREVKYRQVMGN